MKNLQIINGHPVFELLSVDSSNNYAATLLKNGNPSEGTVIMSHFQSEGRGQRGTTWSAEPGQNLTFSIVTYPKFVKPDEAYLLTQISALAVYHTVKDLVDDHVKVKWPNDIMIGDQKVAGILIENSISGKSIDSSIIGIGLNVNQDAFPAIRATSLSKMTGHTLELFDCLASFLENFDALYHRAKTGHVVAIQNEYHNQLFRLNQEANYKILGEERRATIKKVDRLGNLILQTENGLVPAGIKDVEFLY
jgi:BirA family biotin operon repressor/biotin-[acetyl-CoA-carboxylase] ligase